MGKKKEIIILCIITSFIFTAGTGFGFLLNNGKLEIQIQETIKEKEILRYYVYMAHNGSAVPLMLEKSTNTYYIHPFVYKNTIDDNYYFYDNSGNIFIRFWDNGHLSSTLPLIRTGDRGLSLDFTNISGYYNNKSIQHENIISIV